MGRLIVTTQMTVDGVTDQLYAADALVLGRKNYEGFAAVWPQLSDDVGYADRINGMPKHVASNTWRGRSIGTPP